MNIRNNSKGALEDEAGGNGEDTGVRVENFKARGLRRCLRLAILAIMTLLMLLLHGIIAGLLGCK